MYSFWIGGILDVLLILLVVMFVKFEIFKLFINIFITVIIILDNEYIISGKDGLVLKDVVFDKIYIFLDF